MQEWLQGNSKVSQAQSSVWQWMAVISAWFGRGQSMGKKKLNNQGSGEKVCTWVFMKFNLTNNDDILRCTYDAM